MEQRFQYRNKVGTIAIAAIIGLGMAGFGGYALATGLRLARRGNVLSPEFSVGMFVFIGVCGIWLAVWGVRMVLAGQREVVVTPQYLDLPASPASSRIVRVPVADIANVTLYNDQLQGQVLMVVGRDRKVIKLARNAFQDENAFAACQHAIESVRNPSTV